MPQLDDLESGEVSNGINGYVSNEPEADPLLNEIQIDPTPEERGNIVLHVPIPEEREPQDPIRDEPTQTDNRFLQRLVERLFLCLSCDVGTAFADPMRDGVQVNSIAVELRNTVTDVPDVPHDPICDEPIRSDDSYMQRLVERLFLYEGDDVGKAFSNLRREILLSDAQSLDAEDEGGISTYEILDKLNDEDKTREYKEPMCLFERLLWTLIQIPYKDKQSTDVVELVLVKSNIDYEAYKNGRVLTLLKEYDRKKPLTVKYLQWQIFSRVAEKYVENRQCDNISQNTFVTASSQSQTDSPNSVEIDKESLFWTNLHDAIVKPELLDEVFEAVFSSGSLELFKLILDEIPKTNPKPTLVCPILVNAVYWSIYVKKENLTNFYKCFDYALEVEHNFAAKDSTYGDTALHFANDFQDSYMMKELLKKHPPIAVKNNKGKFPISNIGKEDFKKFLDSLITDVPTIFLKSLDVWKIMKGIYIQEYKLENVIFVNYNTFLSTNPDGSKEFHDLELIKEIKDSKELWELVDHPVISTLLELHWNQLKYEIIRDQYFCVFVAALIFCLIYAKKKLESFQTAFYRFSDYSIMATAMMFICLELLNNRMVFVKIFKLVKKYLKFVSQKVVSKLPKFKKDSKKCADEADTDEHTAANDEETEKSGSHSLRVYGTYFSFLLTLPLLILLCMYGFRRCSMNEEHCKEIFGIGFIILSLNISLLIGYFSRNVAINLIMLFYVASTGAKFISSTILILLGFAFSLTVLIKDYGIPKDEDAKYTIQQCAQINQTLLSILNNEKSKTISKQSDFSLGFFKTIIMSTGEYEAGDLEFPNFTSYFIFILFVFTIPIVFINLLNALAIEDVQKIKKEAMIWYRKVQIMFLYEYKILHKSIFRPKQICAFLSFNDKKGQLITIYPEVIGEKAFIGIRTTTKEMLLMKDIDKHESIGHLPRDTVENAVRGLNYRKIY